MYSQRYSRKLYARFCADIIPATRKIIDDRAHRPAILRYAWTYLPR
jgi:hypothetical protein